NAAVEETGSEAGEEPGPDDEEEDLPSLEREAHLAAGLIREMVGGSEPFRFYDTQLQAVRDVTYRDIVILMRATRERANAVIEVFRKLGIPSYAELGTGYFAAGEVEVALAMLRVIDNPRQDIPLAAVLRSPAVGLNPGELGRVRLQVRDGSFYDAVVAAARNPELGETAAKLAGFLYRLEGWRTAARRGPLSRLVWQVLEETRYYDYCGGMPGGAQRQANLRALYDRARQFDGFARPGLFRFLRFVERLRESQDLGTAPALGREEDVVRVMSVHKSKGLEFPVVLLLDAGKLFNRQGLQQDVLYHRRLGVGPRVVDADRRLKYPSLAHTAVSCRCRLEALAEEMRILYVAMTRAQERLILVGSCRGLERKRQRWAMASRLPGRCLPDAQLARATSWLDWLGPALVRVGALESMQGTLVPPGFANDAAACWKVSLSPLPGPVRHSSETPGDLGGLTWEAICRLQPPQLLPDPSPAAEIARRLEWTYPRLSLTGRAGKISVSELKRWHDPFREDGEDQSARPDLPARLPRFLADRGLGGLELGVATHAVIRHLDLEQPLDLEGLTRQLESMVQRELVLPAVAQAIAT
ncbi:MAG TPA: helicase-exonuclease AddAB subunit AddA, partial [Clostridiales bacterium UBA8153]|nr:helicase-exonuclease AddAB subunit AddA [Clostridiales bacterium UBA8153]